MSILALMWNALAGFGGLVSIGQQMFFGLGAYAAARLSNAGIPVFLCLGLAGLVVGLFAAPFSTIMLRLKGGEFAIGMWVTSRVAHLLVNLDTLVQGETGTSLIAMNAYPAESAGRSPTGARSPPWPACSLSCSRCCAARWASRSWPFATTRKPPRRSACACVGAKRIIFTLAAFGAGLAGALWLRDRAHLPAQDLFQPAMDRLHDLHGAGGRARHVRRAASSAPSFSS